MVLYMYMAVGLLHIIYMHMFYILPQLRCVHYIYDVAYAFILYMLLLHVSVVCGLIDSMLRQPSNT